MYLNKIVYILALWVLIMILTISWLVGYSVDVVDIVDINDIDIKVFLLVFVRIIKIAFINSGYMTFAIVILVYCYDIALFKLNKKKEII